MPQTVMLCSWNVNGVRAVEKKGFLTWLAASGADVVMLQETKVSVEQLSLSLRQPEPFFAEWHSAQKKGYSGVATFSRQQALASYGIGEERFDQEGRVLISSFPEFTLFNTYFPSGSSGPERVAFKLAFYRSFLQVLRGYLDRGERIIVAGDMNTAYAEIDLARPRENRQTSGFMPEERAALGEYFEAGLIDTYRYCHPDTAKYSWWSQRMNARERNIGWRLDYVLVSANLRDYIVDADILCDVTGSDHCPVTLTLSFP